MTKTCSAQCLHVVKTLSQRGVFPAHLLGTVKIKAKRQFLIEKKTIIRFTWLNNMTLYSENYSRFWYRRKQQ
jgi:hypothetical protein